MVTGGILLERHPKEVAALPRQTNQASLCTKVTQQALSTRDTGFLIVFPSCRRVGLSLGLSVSLSLRQARVNGDAFSDPKFHPVWAKAEELGVPLFIHPTGVPELAKRLAGNGWLGNTIGYPLETTIALSHLIFEGTLDRFPKLKVIAAHGGGYLPSYADRSDHACLVSPTSCNPNIKLEKAPTEYLNQIYFDSVVFTPEAIRHLVAQVGAGQVVLGSDYPYPFQLHPVDHFVASDSPSDNQKADILGRTAARLLNITT
jgi:predicted TIM-barrel fold metal-dependent hydrolase